jgi:adenylate cyclase
MTTPDEPAAKPSPSGKIPLPFLRNVAIGNKLNFGFGLMFLMMLLAAIFSIYGLQSVEKNFERAIDRGMALEILSVQAESGLLQARRREKDFLLRWRSLGVAEAKTKYAEPWAETNAGIRANLKDMTSKLGDDGSPEIQAVRKRITAMEVELGVYEEEFSHLVGLIEKQGFKDTGYEGELRAAVHEVEQGLTADGLDSTTAALLAVRRMEKDYLLRGDRKYVTGVSDAVVALKEAISAAGAGAAVVTRLDASLETYRSAFGALVRTRDEIAAVTERFRGAAHRIEAAAVEVMGAGRSEAKRYLEAARAGSTRTMTTIYVLLGLILLFGSILSYSLAGHLGQPIRLLDETVGRTRAGDRGAQAPVITTDAIGRLASAFNSMNAELRDAMSAVERQAAEIEAQRKVADDLLRNILPEPITKRLEHETTIADWHGQVTVLFADMVGFTQLSSVLSATELVSKLNEVFSAFDDLVQKHGLEKIKTIGDCYMAVGGLPDAREDHAEIVAAMALEMLPVLEKVSAGWEHKLQIRIGLNSGAVVAGVIGKHKFVYDLWGDAVNVASRMESHGVVGRVHISQSTQELLADKYDFEDRGLIEIKGKGQRHTYLIEGPKPTE